LVQQRDDLDDELRAWLQESHDRSASNPICAADVERAGLLGGSAEPLSPHVLRCDEEGDAILR
jgi:hypothetical protein